MLRKSITTAIWAVGAVLSASAGTVSAGHPQDSTLLRRLQMTDGGPGYTYDHTASQSVGAKGRAGLATNKAGQDRQFACFVVNMQTSDGSQASAEDKVVCEGKFWRDPPGAKGPSGPAITADPRTKQQHDWFERARARDSNSS